MSTIYNLNSGKVEVYDLEPKRYAINLYRINELKKVPEDEKIILREDNKGILTNRKGLVYECGNYVLRKGLPKNFEQKEANYDLLSRYYHDIYSHGKVSIRPRKDTDKYIILFDPDIYHDNRLIQITTGLYLEHLLEKGMYVEETLQNSDLSNLKDLFKLDKEPRSSIDIKEMKNLMESGLINNEYEETMAYLEDSSKVFKKIK